MAKILPLALAGAISPTVLALGLVVLSGNEKPRARGLAYLAGVATVTLLISVAVVFVFGAAIPEKQKGSGSDLSGYIDLAFAAILLGLGAVTFATRNRTKKEKGKHDEAPGAHLGRYYLMGLAIMVGNLTTLAVFIPALKEIAIEKVSGADRIVAMATVDVIVLIPAWLPVALYVASPETARRVLNPLNDFLQRHRVAVGVGICLAFAAYLSFLGVKALSS